MNIFCYILIKIYLFACYLKDSAVEIILKLQENFELIREQGYKF